jgi:hypothetical protein
MLAAKAQGRGTLTLTTVSGLESMTIPLNWPPELLK